MKAAYLLYAILIAGSFYGKATSSAEWMPNPKELEFKLLNSPSSSSFRYVSPTGIDSGDCSSPIQPCRTIQYAVNKANIGDTIKVAQGVYRYDALVDPCYFLQTPAVVCSLDKSLSIVGGYAAGQWTTPVPFPELTVIDGENRYRGVANIGYNNIQIAHMTLKNFTIKNARVVGPTYLNPYDPSGVGAGMWVQHASIILEDVVFENNVSIGANTINAGGQADGSGLRIEEIPPGKKGLLRRVTFRGNRSFGGNGAQRGGVAFGALFIYRSHVIIEDSLFENNLAQAGHSSGSGSYGSPPNADGLGGAIGLEKGKLEIYRSRIQNNVAIGGDASQYAGSGYGGGVFVEDFDGNESELVLEDSLVYNNIAIGGKAVHGGGGVGGGLASANVVVKIMRTRFISNTAIGGDSTSGTHAGPGAGGGVYLFAERSGTYDSYMINTLVVSNSVRPGAGNSPWGLGNGGGAGIIVQGKRVDIVFSTIARNALADNQVLGQAILVQPWPSPSNPQFPALLNLSDSIIEGHTVGNTFAAALVVQQSSSAYMKNLLFANNLRHTNQSNVPVNQGNFYNLGNVIVLPGLNSTVFNNPFYPTFDYSLTYNSAARDKSDNFTITIDLEKKARPWPQEGMSDLGALEFYSLPHKLYMPNVRR